MPAGSIRYTREFMDHLFAPRHLVGQEGPAFAPDGVGIVEGGAPGSSLTVWIAVDDEGRIERLAWRAVAMPQVVASTSAMAEWILGGGRRRTLEEALHLTPETVAGCLGGLPAHKIHETVLGPKALREAIGDRFRRLGLAGPAGGCGLEGEERLCHCWGVTAGELREAVSSGATFAEAQDRLGIATGCGRCEPEARALHAWFCEERRRQVAEMRNPLEEG